MNVAFHLALGLALCLLLAPAAVVAQDARVPDPPPAVEEEAPPGVELARTLATATGIAITPLLGVAAVGAWEDYKAGPEETLGLPWYASKWFWIPALTLALLLVFKDPLLGLVPGAKKPLDALDVLENKASAVLATPAVVPMFLSAFAGVQAVREVERMASVPLGGAGVASLAGLAGDTAQAVLLALAATVFLVAFFCVWLAFHAINVLILLSPFGPLDFVLRSVKLAVLAVLGGATLVHPYLGVLVALLIVIASIPVAGWSFRLSVFGSVLAGDLLTLRHRRESPDRQGLRAFVARRVGAARPRTYGRVSVGESGIRFSYRPWLVFRRRSIELPSGSYRLGRGLVCPLLRLQDEEGAPISILRLPPRYRYHEDELVAMLSLAGVDEMPLRQGLRAIGEWLRDVAGRGGREAVRLSARLRDGISTS